MENGNVGIINLIISNKIKDSYLNESVLNESIKLKNYLFETINNSPILQLEFKVYDNLENKTITNDVTATRYIDNNIKLFEVYTLTEIENEHNKLNEFFDNNSSILNNPHFTKKIELYNAINNLVIESVKNNIDVDVDKIHESFTIVLNHIKEKKNKVDNHIIPDNVIDENVIEIAINKFNDKYSRLNEDDRTLLKKLFNSDDNQKFELLESYKNECLLILNNIKNDEINETIKTTIRKINEMKYDNSSDEIQNKIIDNIIDLHELKKGLI